MFHLKSVFLQTCKKLKIDLTEDDRVDSILFSFTLRYVQMSVMREARLELCYSCRVMAEKFGLTYHVYYSYESGARMQSMYVFFLIADYFNKMGIDIFSRIFGKDSFTVEALVPYVKKAYTLYRKTRKRDYKKKLI